MDRGKVVVCFRFQSSRVLFGLWLGIVFQDPKKYPDLFYHRVDQSSELGHPHTLRSQVSVRPPFGSGGRDTLAGGGGPNSDEETGV